MYRTSKATEDIPVSNAGEGLLSRAKVSGRSLAGGYVGTLVPMSRVQGSGSGTYRNVAYTDASGTAVAAGTALVDDTEFEVDTSGRDVILRHTVTTPGNGTEVTINSLTG